MHSLYPTNNLACATRSRAGRGGWARRSDVGRAAQRRNPPFFLSPFRSRNTRFNVIARYHQKLNPAGVVILSREVFRLCEAPRSISLRWLRCARLLLFFVNHRFLIGPASSVLFYTDLYFAIRYLVMFLLIISS